MLAHDMARAKGAIFLIRIEDIDRSRSRPQWEAQIYEDLQWLGLSWPEPVLRQSDRQTAYDTALDRLWVNGLLYPCTCTRRDIQTALSAPQEGVPTEGPDGLIYPGTCRSRPHGSAEVPRPRDITLRLDIALALKELGGSGSVRLSFLETGTGQDGDSGEVVFSGQDMIRSVGDIVVARKDMGTSYHLSVVLDDADQGVTHVVRGQDLFAATRIHVLLQRLLGLPTPSYHHHKLIRDDQGKRLAKRDDARAISKFRTDGWTPDDIRKRVGLLDIRSETMR